ncbi:MAG: hypothetical protein ACON4Y_03410 [Flavobacteriales bacterium]
MKNLITITTLLVALTFTSCQNCKDCQSTTTVNLNIEYFTLDATTNQYVITSTQSYSYSGQGTIGSTDSFSSDTLNPIVLADSFSPILTQELCDQELKDSDNSSVNYEFMTGDTINGLFKYTWTENWDCQ